MLRFKLPDWVSNDYFDKIKSPINDEVNLIQINQIETEGFMQFLEENPEYIHWNTLSKNPAAIHILLKNRDKIKWTYFSENPAAIDILLENTDKICWSKFSKNPHPKAFKYLMENKSKICWENFSLNLNPDVCIYLQKEQHNINWINICSNPNAYEIIKMHYPYFSNYYYGMFINMCSNPNPDIIALLDIDRIRWGVLSKNPAAIDVLLRYPYRIAWATFSENTHPLAIQHMRKNKSKIYWEGLLGNRGAIDLIKEMMVTTPINEYILFNPSLFEVDYKRMSEERIRLLREELMMKSLHPSRIQRLIELGCDIDDL